jgi:hypothetical protein
MHHTSSVQKLHGVCHVSAHRACQPDGVMCDATHGIGTDQPLLRTRRSVPCQERVKVPQRSPLEHGVQRLSLRAPKEPEAVHDALVLVELQQSHFVEDVSSPAQLSTRPALEGNELAVTLAPGLEHRPRRVGCNLLENLKIRETGCERCEFRSARRCHAWWECWQSPRGTCMDAAASPEEGSEPSEHEGRRHTRSPLVALFFLLRHSARGFASNFLFAYNLASGLSVLLHAIRLARQGQPLSLTKLVGEASVKFRVPATRLGIAVGGFTGLYRLLNGAGHMLLKRELPQSDSFPGPISEAESVSEPSSPPSFGEAIRRWAAETGEDWPAHACVFGSAALAAGASSFALKRSTRASLALYVFARALQVIWRAARRRGVLQSVGVSSTVENWLQQLGLSVCSGFMMYAYVMRPEALDPSLRRFMLRAAPVDPVALRFAASVVRGEPVNVDETNAYLNAVCPDFPKRWGAGVLGGKNDQTLPHWPGDLGPPGERRLSWPAWWSEFRAQALDAANPLVVTRPGKLADLKAFLRQSSTRRPPYLSKQGSSPALDGWGKPLQRIVVGPHVPFAPACVLRPQQPITLLHWLETFSSAFRTTFPVYLAISAVPSAAFQPLKLVSQPVDWTISLVSSAARSSVYLASFVTTYMGVVDVSRVWLAPLLPPSLRETRALYFGAGAISGLATFIERPSRRAELLMYCIGRAMEVAAAILTSRRLAVPLPHWDAVLLGLSCAVLVHAHVFDPELLGALPKTVLNALIGRPNES